VKVYCPVCNYELLDAKRFHPMKPMECPNYKTSLKFASDVDKTAPLAMFIIIFMMMLHSMNIVNDNLYEVFLIVGLLIGLYVVFTFKIIAIKNKKVQDEKKN
jgi:hypothetical protein